MPLTIVVQSLGISLHMAIHKIFLSSTIYLLLTIIGFLDLCHLVIRSSFIQFLAYFHDFHQKSRIFKRIRFTHFNALKFQQILCPSQWIFERVVSLVQGRWLQLSILMFTLNDIMVHFSTIITYPPSFSNIPWMLVNNCQDVLFVAE